MLELYGICISNSVCGLLIVIVVCVRSIVLTVHMQVQHTTQVHVHVGCDECPPIRLSAVCPKVPLVSRLQLRTVTLYTIVLPMPHKCT